MGPPKSLGRASCEVTPEKIKGTRGAKKLEDAAITRWDGGSSPQMPL